ncbi:unnamed protein product [Hyaloperonospora brassicae]|uniref:Uncharacterized protein n=1 Tax=Hyaloperonospora brassicae TaxID=162125 RepID=A0AAV0V9U1_HYABA|nr:unnamed protein product [Hyaloperonospora brassicae]
MPRSVVTYRHLSTFLTFEDATAALHTYDAFHYIMAYNYGPSVNGKVYRCISHESCGRRLRVAECNNEEAEIPVTFQLAVAGVHGTRASTRRRVGIDMSLKAEVDAFLTQGMQPKTCRLVLEKKYAKRPKMLAKLPNEAQVRNRLLTLRRHKQQRVEGAGTTDSTSSTASSPLPALVDDSLQLQEDSESEWVDDGAHLDAEDATSSTGEPGGGDKPERFDKAKLMRDFAALPGRPVLWNVLKKTRYVDDESEEVVTEWTTGRVVKWQTRENAPTKWVVHYTDGEKRAFALEELVDEIEASIKQGLDVMNRQGSF